MQNECKCNANALQNPKNGMQKNANKIKENKIKENKIKDIDIYNNKKEKENKIKEKEKKEKSFSALSGNLGEGEKPPDELGQFLKNTVFKYTF